MLSLGMRVTETTPVFAIDAAWQVLGVQLSSCTMVGRVGVYKRGRPWRGFSIVMLGVMECISHRGSAIATAGSSYSFSHEYTVLGVLD